MSDPYGTTRLEEEIEDLFHRACRLPESERKAFLDEMCRGRPALRDEVASLLACEDASEIFFDRLEGALFSSPDGEGDGPAAELVERYDPLVGRIVRQYQITGVLGQGGMGVVYRARDTSLGRDVALKFLAPGLGSDPKARERLLKEAKAAANLDHPNICNVHEIGETPDGRLFIAMALYEGESLRDRLAHGGASLAEALDVARQTCAGLRQAHARGIVHRDVTPGNLFRTEDGTIKILDFGIARIGETSQGRGNSAVGTLQYMAPEQVRADPVDLRADVWSLAIVIYRLLAGRTPFQAETPAAVVAGILNDEPAPLRTLDPDIPERVDRAILRALEKDPADRPATAEEFFEDLTGERLTSTSPTVVLERARWSTGKRVAAGIVALAGVVGAGWLLSRVSPAGPPSSAGGELTGPVLVLPSPSVAAENEGSDEDARVAEALGLELDRWTPVQIVSSLAVREARSSLGLVGPPGSRQAAVELGRRAGAEAVVLVHRDRGLRAEATVVDVASGRESSDLLRTAGPDGDVVIRLAHLILGLPGTADRYEEMHAQSNSVPAWSAFEAGRGALASLRLREAERHLRDAIAVDSTFADAHHHLAMTLYWREPFEDAFLPGLGGAIARHSGTAARLAESLPAGMRGLDRVRDHIRAFDLLQRDGRIEESRRIYERLLAEDSTDAFAWLGSGLVEYRDQGTLVDERGELRVRASWNRAVDAFERARGREGFHLGYGHWFEIHERLIRETVDPLGCHTFSLPAGERLRVWESPRATGQSGFRARIAADTIAWVPCRNGVRPESDQPEIRDSLRRAVEREVGRWIALAPEHPAPYERRARWRLFERDLVGSGPTRRVAPADSLARSALRDVEFALSLREDTLPEDLFYLGSLYLGAGRAGDALRTVEAALAREAEPARAEAPPPVYAASALLANGRPTRALEIVKPDWKQTFNFTVPDTVSGRILESGWIGDLLADAFVDGVTGHASERSAAAVRRLAEMWRGEHGNAAHWLQKIALPQVGPALVLHPELMRDWFRGWPSVPGRYATLLDPGGTPDTVADDLLRDGFRAVEAREAAKAWVTGLAAQAAGFHELAIDLFDAIERMVLPIDAPVAHAGWSLRTLALERRARSHEALGEPRAARDAYRAFLAAWPEPEPGLQPLLEGAAARLAKLEEQLEEDR